MPSCYICTKEIGPDGRVLSGGTKICASCNKFQGFENVSSSAESAPAIEVPDFLPSDEPTGKFNRLPQRYIVTLEDHDLSTVQLARKARLTKLAIGPVPVLVYRVTAGFRLKQHAAAFGKCVDDFNYIQSWDFDDKPTTDRLVYCTIFPDGFKKSAKDQKAALWAAAWQFNMSASHLKSFGPANLIALILLHYRKETNKLLLPNNIVVRTETVQATGKRRICFNQDESSGLKCQNGLADLTESNSIGCLAIGIDEIG